MFDTSKKSCAVIFPMPNGDLYTAQIGGSQAFKTSSNGQRSKTAFLTSAGQIEDLAVVEGTGRVYWSDNNRPTIFEAPLADPGITSRNLLVKNVLSTSGAQFGAIAVHPTLR